MTRNQQIRTIIQHCQDGLETLGETTRKLDAMQVRGGFDTNDGLAYTGYDYREQKWIKAP